MNVDAAKAEARRAAFARRKAAHEAGHPAPAAHLEAVLEDYRGRPLAGYMPMRTEIDPLPAMAAHDAAGAVVGVPVIMAPATPLRFARWWPGMAMVAGDFGALVPARPEWIEPEVLVVPLVAFDRRGGRLGYGGGFYDRTLAGLRARGPVVAIGFAWAAQEGADLPLEAVDEPLDLIVTESGVIRPDPAPRAPGRTRERP